MTIAINNDIPEHIRIGNFLNSEYTKRCVEEYDTSTLESICDIRKYFKKHSKLKQGGIFKVVMKYALEKYYEYITGEHTYTSQHLQNLIIDFPEFFHFKPSKYTKLYDELCNISIKYNIAATELLYPTDFRKVANLISLGIFSPQMKYTFINTYSSPLETISTDNHIIFFYNRCTPMTHEISKNITSSIVLTRKAAGEVLSKYETDLLERAIAEDRISNFRSSSYYSRIIGLIMWDDKKNNFRPNSYLPTLKRLTPCGFADLESCEACEKRESCKKIISTAYKTACISIARGSIEPTSSLKKQGTQNTNISSATTAPTPHKEPTSPYCLKRYPPNWP